VPQLDPADVIALLRGGRGENLKWPISQIENQIKGIGLPNRSSFLTEARASKNVLAAAGEMKRLSGQIDVVIHALGIFLCLPKIFEGREYIEYASLGDGNTGRAFDLETDRRAAEFKFIQWQGVSESIRQNSVFKDFFFLADSSIEKENISMCWARLIR